MTGWPFVGGRAGELPRVPDATDSKAFMARRGTDTTCCFGVVLAERLLRGAQVIFA